MAINLDRVCRTHTKLVSARSTIELAWFSQFMFAIQLKKGEAVYNTELKQHSNVPVLLMMIQLIEFTKCVVLPNGWQDGAGRI